MAKYARSGEWRPRSNESEELGAPGREVARDEESGRKVRTESPAPEGLFEKLVRILRSILWTLPAARRLDAHGRDDALQEASVRLLRCAPGLSGLPEGRLIALARVVLFRCCEDLRRTQWYNRVK